MYRADFSLTALKRNQSCCQLHLRLPASRITRQYISVSKPPTVLLLLESGNSYLWEEKLWRSSLKCYLAASNRVSNASGLNPVYSFKKCWEDNSHWLLCGKSPKELKVKILLFVYSICFSVETHCNDLSRSDPIGLPIL